MMLLFYVTLFTLVGYITTTDYTSLGYVCGSDMNKVVNESPFGILFNGVTRYPIGTPICMGVTLELCLNSTIAECDEKFVEYLDIEDTQSKLLTSRKRKQSEILTFMRDLNSVIRLNGLQTTNIIRLTEKLVYTNNKFVTMKTSRVYNSAQLVYSFVPVFYDNSALAKTVEEITSTASYCKPHKTKKMSYSNTDIGVLNSDSTQCVLVAELNNEVTTFDIDNTELHPFPVRTKDDEKTLVQYYLAFKDDLGYGIVSNEYGTNFASDYFIYSNLRAVTHPTHYYVDFQFQRRVPISLDGGILPQQTNKQQAINMFISTTNFDTIAELPEQRTIHQPPPDIPDDIDIVKVFTEKIIIPTPQPATEPTTIGLLPRPRLPPIRITEIAIVPTTLPNTSTSDIGKLLTIIICVLTGTVLTVTIGVIIVLRIVRKNTTTNLMSSVRYSNVNV